MSITTKDLQPSQKQIFSEKQIDKYLGKSNEVIMVKEVIILIKKLLDINVDIVIYQENESIDYIVVFCVQAEEIKSTMLRYHTKKITLISVHKDHHQKKKWNYIKIINSVKNIICHMDISMEKKKYPMKTV